ncbi:MAG: Nramp family divalent metal transporter [Pyrinomonadaceae bacterium]
MAVTNAELLKKGQRLGRRGARGVRQTFARRKGLLAYLAIIGPGMVAANAGNDAGGIATYAQAGAAYGYTLLWSLIPVTISLAIIQEMCARMGVVTGKGLADLIREQFGVRWTMLVMLALLIANGGVTVSEFVGIAAGAELFGVPRYVSVPMAAAAVWWLVVKGSYRRVERVFLLMSLVFLGYIVSAFLAKPEWAQVGHAIVRPSFSFERDYLFMFVSLIGTTISPYMQVFVQSSVVEKGIKVEDYSMTRADVWIGTLFAVSIAAFIIISTAATLHLNGITKIELAEDAAKALAPLAGNYAKLLFGLGIFGASMLAAGVLPLSTAYSISEALGFEKGVSRSFREAPIFLSIFTFLICVGTIIAILTSHEQQINVLLITQFINGLLLPVLLIAILRLANNRELMSAEIDGQVYNYANGRVYNIAAWLTVIIVSVLSISSVVMSFLT